MTKKSRANSVKGAQRKQSPNSTWLLIGGIALVGIAVLVLVWFALTPNRGNGGTPQLQVNTDLLDLGKQTLGKSVHASFEVKNTGNGTLTLNVPRVATLLEGC